jgi:hypothetical protein
VYAPLYYGYGTGGGYFDRRVVARNNDAKLLKLAPDTFLVLLKASAETIRERLRLNPHPHNLIKESDVELILERFEEQFAHSLLTRKITLDTTGATAETTLDEFVQRVEPYLTDEDRIRILVHSARYP